MATPNPPLDITHLDKRKHTYLITRQLSDTTSKLEASNLPLPEDHLVVDKTKNIIKIGRNVPWRYTPNHTHDEQYASLHHNHYFGYGEKWLPTVPKLWLTTDLSNHPELVACRGQLLSTELSGKLWTVYGRYTDLIAVHPDQYPYNLISVACSHSVDQQPHLLYPTPDYAAIPIQDSQDTVVLTVHIQYDQVLPLRYGWNQLSGCYPTKVKIEGKTTTQNWIVLDERNITYASRYDIDIPGTTELITAIRYTWSQWNISGTPVFKCGYVRLYGHTENLVRMPYLPSPPGYVYVVPVEELGIGLKHEEIGDIGYTGTLQELLPPNRLPCDGRTVPITQYPELYARIGQRYAPLTATLEYTPDSTVVLEYTYDTPQILGSWIFRDIAPHGWIIKGRHNSTMNWITISEYNQSYFLDTDKKYYNSPSTEGFTQYCITLQYTTEPPGSTGSIELYSADVGIYYLPYIRTATDTTPYIVTRVRTEDINSLVVLDLQNIISQLQSQIVQITQRLVAVEVYQQNHP